MDELDFVWETLNIQKDITVVIGSTSTAVIAVTEFHSWPETRADYQKKIFQS